MVNKNTYKHSNSQIHRIYSIESKNQVNGNYSQHLRSPNPIYGAQTLYTELKPYIRSLNLIYGAPTVPKPPEESLILLCCAGPMKCLCNYIKW